PHSIVRQATGVTGTLMSRALEPLSEGSGALPRICGQPQVAKPTTVLPPSPDDKVRDIQSQVAIRRIVPAEVGLVLRLAAQILGSAPARDKDRLSAIHPD